MAWVRSSTLCCFLFFIITFPIGQSRTVMKQDGLQCKDENNQPVDWFVMYKIPKISETSDPLIKKGISYLYMTNSTVDSGWKLSTKNISSADSIPGYTLAPLYSDEMALKNMWVLYNDQSPKGNSNAKYGHSKGVVMTDGAKGFWLIHSVPGFPPIPRIGVSRPNRNSNSSISENSDSPDGEYSYPDSGKNYGQSFMCISVNADQVDVIARQLIYNQIITYRKNLPASLASDYPVFVNASNRVRIKNPPYTKKVTIKSSGGTEFVSFAKSDKWQKDLYDDFVGPQLNSDLLVESWLNGRGKLPSECTGPRVLNVESVVLGEANVNFKSSHDHSKWAVSASKGKNRNWVCVGDINRADTQFNRGGGTVCLNLPNLWTHYKNTVNEVEACPSRKSAVNGN